MCFAKYFQATILELPPAIAYCPVLLCVSSLGQVQSEYLIAFVFLQVSIYNHFRAVVIFVLQFFLYLVQFFLFPRLTFSEVIIQVLLLYFLMLVLFVKSPIPCDGLPLIS